MFVYGIEGRWLTKLGETKFHILQVFSRSDFHRYGIWKMLAEEYAVKITVPSVYQHLTELEALHILRKDEARPLIRERKRWYYTLTEKCKDHYA